MGHLSRRPPKRSSRPSPWAVVGLHAARAIARERGDRGREIWAPSAHAPGSPRCFLYSKLLERTDGLPRSCPGTVPALSVVPDGRYTRCAAFAAAMGRTSRALSRTASNLRRSFSSKNSEGRKSKSDAGEGGDAEATEPSSQAERLAEEGSSAPAQRATSSSLACLVSNSVCLRGLSSLV